jgi:hypothetical protein
MHAHACVVGLVALGISPGCAPSASAPTGGAPKGNTVKSYEQRAEVTGVALTPAGSVADALGGLLAVAPDGRRWALATLASVRFFDGDKETRAVHVPNGATQIRFSADGRTLHLGSHDVDAATGVVTTAKAPSNLAPWVKQAGLPAPAQLGLGAVAASADGTLIVGGASDSAFDRRGPMLPAAGADSDWLIALDGAWKPLAVMWHGRGAISQISVGERFVAAGGTGPVRIFARDALTKELGTSPFRGTIGVAWAPGDALLAAVGGGKQVAVWLAGSWGAPAAGWEVGGAYQSAVAFHPARPVLAVANHDGHLRLYGVAAGQLAKPPLLLDKDAGGDIRGIAWSADGARLWIAAGPPAGKVLQLTVAVTP